MPIGVDHVPPPEVGSIGGTLSKPLMPIGVDHKYAPAPTAPATPFLNL